MTECNITIPSDSIPDELLATVKSNALVPLKKVLIDPWKYRFSVSNEFVDYLESETSNPATLFSDIASAFTNPDKEYKELVYLHNEMRQGNQTKAFMKYFAEDGKYSNPLFEMSIDGKSRLCTLFLTCCEKEGSTDELKVY